MRWVAFIALFLTGPFAGTFGILCAMMVVLDPSRGRLPSLAELFWTAVFTCWWGSLVWAYRRPLTFRPALVFGERPADVEASLVFYKRLALAACLISISLGLLITVAIHRSHFMLD